MESIFKESGLSLEQLTEITKDTIYEMASRIDLKDVIQKVKAKHPDITKEQWDIIVYDADGVPDIRDRDVLEQFMNELNVDQFIATAYADWEDSNKETKIEE